MESVRMAFLSQAILRESAQPGQSPASLLFGSMRFVIFSEFSKVLYQLFLQPS